jgi:hypothetical protein
LASIILSDNYGSSQVRKQPIKACTHALQILRYLYLPCISKNRRKFAKKIRSEKLDSHCMKIWIFLWKYEFFFENMNFSLKIWIFLLKFENIILTFAAIWVFYFFSIQKWANALNDYFCKWIWLSSTFELFFCKKRNVHLHLIERNSISKEVQQSRMKGRRKNIIKHL